MTESELVDCVGKSVKNALETRIPGDGDSQVARRRKKSKGRCQPHCEPQPHHLGLFLMNLIDHGII